MYYSVIVLYIFFNIIYYSKSLRLGLRDGSFDKNPKVNNDTKNITVAYTKTFNVNIINILLNIKY